MVVYGVTDDNAIEHQEFCANLASARRHARMVAARGEPSIVTRHVVRMTKDALVCALNRSGWATESNEIEHWEPTGDPIGDGDTYIEGFTYRIRRIPLRP